MTERLHPLLRQVGLAVPPGLENADVSTVSCDSRRVGADHRQHRSGRQRLGPELTAIHLGAGQADE